MVKIQGRASLKEIPFIIPTLNSGSPPLPDGNSKTCPHRSIWLRPMERPC